MKKQILFVDDEENLLRGVQRLLRSQRNKWDLHFASNGIEALDIIRKQAISVIVSDMRMPGMDGADVLEKVSELSPTTIRFILSGQSSEESMMRAYLYAHLYLSKPCDQKYMTEMLERACALHDLIECSEIHALTSKMGALPSVPISYDKLLDEMALESNCTQALSRIIDTDIALSSRVLKTINQAYFAWTQPVTSIEAAMHAAGKDRICMMALLGELINRSDSESFDYFKIETLWEHFNRCAVIARHIVQVEKLPQEDVNTAEAIALLYGIGKLVMVERSPELYQSVISMVEEKGVEISDAESAVYGSSSTEVGAYLLGLWGAPVRVIRGVANYTKLDTNSNEVYLSAVVHVSVFLDHEMHMGAKCHPGLNFSALLSLGIDEAKVKQWRTVVQGVFDGCST